MSQLRISSTVLKVRKHVVQENKTINHRKFLLTDRLDFMSTDCDGIDEREYAQLAKTKSKYSCVLCRGEKEERMDSFHRKNRSKTS